MAELDTTGCVSIKGTTVQTFGDGHEALNARGQEGKTVQRITLESVQDTRDQIIDVVGCVKQIVRTVSFHLLGQ